MSNSTPYTNFLDIPPTEIKDFSLPTYSFEYSENMLGLETRRVISDDGRHSEITVFYNHLNADEVQLLIEFYNERVPVGRGFGLPQGLLDFPSNLFQEYLTTIGLVLYYFKKRPTITTNQVNGTYSVIMKLEAKPVVFNAPDEITGILTSSITASVDTSVPFVQWEQIAGQDLIIQSPNSPTTLITAAAGNITNLLGDIIIRVYLIDNPDIFKDVFINAKPVDTARYIISARNSFISETADRYRIPLPLQWDYASQPGESDINLNDTNDFDPFIARWLPPPFTNFLIQYDIEVWDGFSWNIVTTIPVNTSPTYNGFNAEEVFRIVAVHRVPGSSNDIRAESGILFIDPPNATGDIVTGADVFGIISTSASYITEVDNDLDVTLTELIIDGVDTERCSTLLSSISIFITETDTDLDLVNGGSILVEDDYNAHLSSQIIYITEVDFDLEGGIIG